MHDDSGSTPGSIRSKVRRATRRVGLSGASPATPEEQRLPPGQRLVGKLPVLDLGVHPVVQPADWRLVVAGAVETPLRWDWDTLMARRQTTLMLDIHCVTNWSVYDQQWTGVLARDLLDEVRPMEGAQGGDAQIP